MIGGICHYLVILLLLKSSICDPINEIFAAIKNDDTTTLKRILNDNEATLGSFINLQDSESGQTPVMMSVLRGRTEMVRSLLAVAEVDVTIGEMQGYTVAHGAGFQGRAEILKLLLEDERDIDMKELHSDGFSPLHRACWGQEPRHTETVKVFLELAGVPWDLRSKKGTTCYDVTNNPATKKLLKQWKKKQNEEL